MNVLDRLWSHVDKSGECWLWTASKDRYGYGLIKVDDRTMTAHRLVAALTFDDFNPNLHVLHSCDTPSCVRPEHLRQGTHSDNMQDRHQRNRKVACKRGHSLTDLDNVRVEKDGRHSCRACERVRAAAKRAELRTKRNDDRNSTTHPVPTDTPLHTCYPSGLFYSDDCEGCIYERTSGKHICVWTWHPSGDGSICRACGDRR